MTIPAPGEEVLAFIRNYAPVDRHRIRFKWNGKHGADLVDSNAEFRNAVVVALGEFEVAAPLELVRDAYDEETSFAREAWGAYPRLWILGQTLLNQGQEAYVVDYFRGKVKSFDTEIACGGVEVPRDLAIRLANHLETKTYESDEERGICLYGAQYLRELADPPLRRALASKSAQRQEKKWWRFW